MISDVLRRALAIVVLILLASPAPSRANGRKPEYPINVAFKPGDSQSMYVGATFGFIQSHDDGAHWSWTCEQNVGYTGFYDPVYAVDSMGTIFATTPMGITESHDGGCNFMPAGGTTAGNYMADIQVASDGTIWTVSGSATGTNDVWVSRDHGATFTSANNPLPNGFWKTIRVAPTDPNRIYVTGFTVAGTSPTPLLYRSDDAGTSWTPIPFTMPNVTLLLLLGVSPTNEDVVFARVDDPMADHLLRSSNGTMTFTDVYDLNGDDISGFVARADGTTVLAGGHGADVISSTDDGVTWQSVAGTPTVNCLGERGDGALFVCSEALLAPQMALGKSSDGASWTKIMGWENLTDLQCPSDSRHATMCSFTGTACQLTKACPPDGGPGNGVTPGAPSVCGCGIASALIIFVIPRRRRKRTLGG
jgi:photosystem II stability/assembly factor-like uncharacterized protein